ncbi:hypothetical protein B1B_01340 [mine drainage metagenome]|uniref:Glycosyltransferase n=1 Tax=mine drainage metagenome TaxID=410659 RepID=T1D3Q8_9ZZZZ
MQRADPLSIQAALASHVGPVSLWGSPEVSHPFFSEMKKRYHLTLETQEGSDVGARMEHALGMTLQDHPHAILTGTDLMHPTPALYIGAAQALESGAQATLAPSTDGGYVLIGLSRMIPTLFREMAWGSDGVGAETIRRLETLGCSVVVLPHQRDVDTLEDYADWSAVDAQGTDSAR